VKKIFGILLVLALVLSFSLVATTPVAGATPIYVDAARADDAGDGTSWVTAKKYIQSGINIVDTGGTVYVAAGTYQENLASWKDMEITKSLTLIGAGSGQTIVELTQGKMNGVEIRGSGLSVTIEGITFTRQPGQTYASNYGLRIAETTSTFDKLVLRDVEILHAPDTGVHLGSAGTFADVTIDDCKFSNNKWALAHYGGTVTTMAIENSKFQNNTYMTVVLSGSYGTLTLDGVEILDSGHFSLSLSGTAAVVTIVDCDIIGGGGNRFYSSASIGELTIQDSRFIGSTNNIVVDFYGGTIGKLVFSGVEVANAVGPNIRFTSSPWTTIGELQFINCNVHGATGGGNSHGVYLMGNADKIMISGSHFNSNTGRGFDFAPLGSAAVNDVTVFGSTFDSNTRDGIGISQTTNAAFTGITASNNGGAGVCLWEWRVRSADLHFANSTFESNGWNGLVFVTQNGRTVENVSVVGCTITDNTVRGVEFWRYDGGTISSVAVNFCNIAGNGDGVAATDMVETVDATHNWWGDASGPNGEGPGTGDAVSTNVDFEPWLEAAITDQPTGCTADRAYGAGAEAETDNVSAKATTGGGPTTTVTVAEYVGNPTAVNPGFQAGFFFDVHVGGTEPDTLVVTCNCPGGDCSGIILKWFDSDDGKWKNVSPVSNNNGEIVATLSGTSSPTIAQLTGTPFTLSNPPTTVGWEGSSVNKAAVMAPWIALMATMMAGASLLVLRRRRAQI